MHKQHRVLNACGVSMLAPTLVDFYIDSSIDCSTNQLIDYSWTFPSIDVKTRIIMYGETGQGIFDLTKKESSSANVFPHRLLNDSISRKKIWDIAFPDSEMPKAEAGAVEESFGLLDNCFANTKLTSDDVMDLLKKAK